MRRQGFVFASRRQRSEQYRTSSQTFAHFFRHVNGRPQTSQVLTGRSDFATRFGMSGDLPANRPGALCVSAA